MLKTRQMVKDTIGTWEGRNEADGSYKKIIDIYNSFSGKLPRGIKMQYSWPWCACTWSALAIYLKFTDIMPIEISCYYLIEAAKKMNIWNENDMYVPQVGDACLYHWADSSNFASTDCLGVPDHVGVVTEVYAKAGYFVVTEGNYQDKVKKRTVSINGRYIRGFITPRYDYAAVNESVAKEPGKDIRAIAHEVIAGGWGNDPERSAALKSLGYDPAAVQKEVNAILNGAAVVPENKVQDQSQKVTHTVDADCKAQVYNGNVAGKYITTADLYLRIDAGTNKKAMCVIPKGTSTRCYGYYTEYGGTKWLLIEVIVDGVQYTGFSSSTYLKKA